MHTLVPHRCAALTHALALARRLGLRAELEAPGRISRDLWTVTVEAALARRHLAVVGGLLQSELLPAVAEATAALGQAVSLASTPPHARVEPWPVELLPRLDRIAQRVGRACQVLTVAEQRRALLSGGPPPLARHRGAVGRVLGRVLVDLQAVDGWPAVAGRLGDALEGLVGPVTALVDRIDADDLPGVEPSSVKRAMIVAHEAVAEALLLALGQLDDPASPRDPVPTTARSPHAVEPAERLAS